MERGLLKYLVVVIKELDGLHTTIGKLVCDAQHPIQEVQNVRILCPARQRSEAVQPNIDKIQRRTEAIAKAHE